MKKRMKQLVSFGLAGVMALSLAACGGSSGETSAAAAGDTAAAESAADTAASAGDKVLNVHLDVEVASLDYQQATDGTSFEVTAATVEGLFSVDADGNPSPAMAESEEVSEDGLTRTFKIRENANWSNGDPVTAQDFVFAWQRAVDPALASEYAFIIGIAGVKNAEAIAAGEMPVDQLGVKALDDKTLEVSLDVPVAFFDSLMNFPTFYPVNQAFYESCGDQYASTPDTLLANGPYKIVSYEPAATTIEMVKNENYWDADAVKLDGLKFQVIKETQQALLSYQSGDLDIAKIAGEQVEQYQNDPEYKPVQMGYLWYLSPNQTVAGLENENLRKAIALSYDKEAVVKNVTKDGSLVANYAVPVGLATGPDGTDFRDDPSGERNQYLATDKAKAAEYFEQAKAELGQDTFEYTMIVEDTESAINVAQFLQQEIQTTLPGVTINIQQMPKKERVERMQTGDFEIGLTRWGPDYADPMTYLDMWTTDSPNNYGHWSNPDYDAMIENCKKGELAADPEARWEELKAAEKIVMDAAVIFPIYQKCDATLVKSNVSGIEFHSVGINRVYKNADKQ
ncbi:MAG: peptide ABC transporter substrate-binding protein [Eubacteriales bacterium]|nr:peptide ABC transporter substrate-binding protein [Eubacteriales bacterium]